MRAIKSAILNHRHFLIVVTILIVVMTWPTILYVFRTDVAWLPSSNGDAWNKFWDAWYGSRVLSGEANFAHTNLMFFPEGVSLSYHIFSIPHMVVFGLLQLVIPISNAFNLTYLLIIFSSSLSAYICLDYLFKDKWIALFGSIVFGCCANVVGRPVHPDVATLATIPLSFYFVHRSIIELRRSFALMAGILIGVTAFIGLYVFVCLVISVGVQILYFAAAGRRDRRFWFIVTAIVAVVAVFGSLRAYPMLTDERALESILNKLGGREEENDLLQFFINYENPLYDRLITNRITSSIVKLPDPGNWNTSYLGYIPLLLIGIGIFGRRHRKRLKPWAIMVVFFLLMRLGSVLTINGHEIAGFFLPKHFLVKLVPVVFEGFYSTDLFQIGALFPIAVLSCFGLASLLQRVPKSRQSFLVLFLIVLLTVEYYRSPREQRIVTEEEYSFIDWLAAEDNQEIRLINLPMGRLNSKQYLFYQTLNGFPQVEGLATRTPSQTYDYIRSNLLLETWRQSASIVCEEANRGEYLAALDQLVDDGFSHIVLYYSRREHIHVELSFASVEPAYRDIFVAIYHLPDLGKSCV